MDQKLLKPEEAAVYALRALYSRYGYMPYKMSKFEEYDLYVKNKDFLISDGIITFTDTRGKLLALKPDVTLSIIKNSKDVGASVNKVYYNENVYRIGKGSHTFKELMQTGLECIGALDDYHITEVLSLALRSLATLSENYMLDLAHVGLVGALLDVFSLEDGVKAKILTAIGRKNTAELLALKREDLLSEDAFALATALMTEYASFRDASEALAPYAVTDAAKSALSMFGALCATMATLGFAEKIRIDFSVINHTSYYSGVVFKGYVKGIPDSVLAGGQYDCMMRKMGRRDGAIGFAVYLDALERRASDMAAYDTDILLLQGGADVADVLLAVEKLSRDGSRVTVAKKRPENIRWKTLYVMDGKEARQSGDD